MRKQNKTIIIIGGGVSGMAAGCYTQMNGFDTKLFEMHSIPGGCCTAWNRKEYTFDMCIEWLLGSGKGNLLNQIWQELGALDGKKIVDFDVFNYVRGEDGRVVKFYNNPDQLEKHLKEFSSQDKEPIEEFCQSLREFTKMDFFMPLLKPVRLWSAGQIIKLIWQMRPFKKELDKSEKIKMADFSARFKDPLLQKAFKFIFFQDHVTFPLLPYYLNVACAANYNAGFPEGGSLGFARSIENRYKELGGEIQYNAKVREIITEGNRATGVILEDGTKHFADIIISSCDGLTTMKHLLDGKYSNKVTDRLYNELINEPLMTYPSGVAAFFGVNREFSQDEPHSTTYLLSNEESENLPGVTQNSFVVQIRTLYSPEFAPKGKSVLYVYYLSDYDYWIKFYNDKEEYKKRKDQIAKFIIDYMDKIYPGLKEQVEVTDVSTPVTVVRYTGNFKGSIMAWKPFSEAEDCTKKIIEKQGMKVPGLKNVYLTGHWISMGGLIRAASSGRHVAHYICRDNKKKFEASIAN